MSFPAVPAVEAAAVPAAAALVDVREDDEWEAGHIEGALHVPMGDVPDHLGELAELADAGDVVVVCRSGARSARVVAWLARQGVDTVNLEGGMGAWEGAGRPMVSETGAEPFVR